MQKLVFFGKAISFALALLLLLVVLLKVLAPTSVERINTIFLILVVLAINIALPRVLSFSGEKNFSGGLKQGTIVFAKTLNRIIVAAALLFTYWVAVFFVFILSRALGKTFLAIGKEKGESYWKNTKKNYSLEYFKKQF